MHIDTTPTVPTTPATAPTDFKAYLAGLGWTGPTAEADYWANCKIKFEAMRAKKLRDGDYGDYLLTFGSHECFQPFLDIIPRLSDREYWQNLTQVWTRAEATLPDRKIWLRLFQSKRPGREHLMNDDERASLAAMPNVIKLWRGCGHESAIGGLSWTLNPERAAFFAGYACGPRRQDLVGQTGTEPILVKATCRKSDVLAYFTHRKESEIVIHPDHVTYRRTSPAPAPKKIDPEQKHKVLLAFMARVDQAQNTLTEEQ